MYPGGHLSPVWISGWVSLTGVDLRVWENGARPRVFFGRMVPVLGVFFGVFYAQNGVLSAQNGVLYAQNPL